MNETPTNTHTRVAKKVDRRLFQTGEVIDGGFAVFAVLDRCAFSKNRPIDHLVGSSIEPSLAVMPRKVSFSRISEAHQSSLEGRGRGRGRLYIETAARASHMPIL